MGLLQRRIVVYLCLSLALALAAPLVTGPDKRHQQKSQTVVFLSALALTPRALAPACSRGPFALNDQALKKYPALGRAIATILKRGPEWGAVSIPGSQPAALIQSLAGKKVSSLCFTHLKRVYRLQLHPWGGGARLWAVGVAPGVEPQVPRIGKEQLERFPALARYLESLTSLALPSRRPGRRRGPQEGLSSPYRFYQPVTSTLSARDWRSLLAQLDLDAKWPVFRWGDFLVAGRQGTNIRRATVPVPGLFNFKLTAAVLLALIGLWLGRGIYRQGAGIAINPPWAGMFGDLIFILTLGFGALGLVDYLQVSLLGTQPLMDEALRVVSGLMYLPCLLFMAWFTSNLVGQSLEISDQGLVHHGPAGKVELSWEDIQGLELKDSNLLVGRGDMVLPRRLQTLLIIKTRQGEVAVFEPGLRSTKQKIISALARNAPPHLQKDISRLAGQW